MKMCALIEIRNGVAISEDELVYKVSRSGGPGGQNVNKLNTRVTILFDVANSRSFSDAQKQRILTRLSNRADKNGVIRVISQRFRTQKANRQAALLRLQEILQDALKVPVERKKTVVPYTAKQRRLKKKRGRSLLKQQRAERDFGF
jgi:ribosome-associated protein